jgi:molecular chaperone DnaK (HSP70)
LFSSRLTDIVPNPAQKLHSEKGRLSADEIERMVREAEEYADEDAAFKKRIDALNAFQSESRRCGGG